MSNRRRLPSEKATRLRCPKCRGIDLSRKDGGYMVHVCQRCGHAWPQTTTAPPSPTDETGVGPMSTEREALAELLREIEAAPQIAADPRAIIETRNWTYEADAILDSDWLAQVKATARAEALREFATTERAAMAEAWGGDASWLTTGTKVADVVADWLTEAADEIGGAQ